MKLHKKFAIPLTLLLVSGCSNSPEEIKTWEYIKPDSDFTLYYHFFDEAGEHNEGSQLIRFDVEQDRFVTYSTYTMENGNTINSSRSYFKKKDTIVTEPIENPLTQEERRIVYPEKLSLGVKLNSESEHVLVETGLDYETESDAPALSPCIRLENQGDNKWTQGNYKVYCKGIGLVESGGPKLGTQYLMIAEKGLQ